MVNFYIVTGKNDSKEPYSVLNISFPFDSSLTISLIINERTQIESTLLNKNEVSEYEVQKYLKQKGTVESFPIKDNTDIKLMLQRIKELTKK
jgi:hypothetical protein